MTGGSLSPEARRRLLTAAREAIAARLAGRPLPSPEAGDELGRPCAAFVTLTRRADGELRGCVGFVEPRYPLLESVARAAAIAATEDTRFPPVSPAELPSLAIEISVLGPVAPVDPGAVEVGRHGLIVRRGGLSGLLLPQVATEHGWDRETFLGHTCRKAGLPPGAWKQAGTELLAFTATVFGEEG